MDCRNVRKKEQSFFCNECNQDWYTFMEINGVDNSMEKEVVIDYLYHFLRVNMKQ